MSKTPEPVMATNPYTNKIINVQPLFEFYTNQDNAAARMDDVIKTMLINGIGSETSDLLVDNFPDFKTLFLYLYDIKEMFQRMDECQITISKK